MQKIVLLMVFGVYATVSVAQPTTTEAQAEPNLSPLDRRVKIEKETRFQPFVLSTHRPNYLITYSYSFQPNQAPFDSAFDGVMEEQEIKFQFSLKLPIVDGLFGEDGTIYFAYTNLSFWQAYNSDNSRPFRETNHEPEVFMSVPNDWSIWGFKNKINIIGLSHQSNGRSGSQSRSWNRIYADFIFEREHFYLSIKPWWRIDDPDGVDDNPDIEDFMGHGELRLVYAKGDHTVSLMTRNNFQAKNRGAWEINYSLPMSRRAKWFLQYFDGYGESMIDYNARIKRLGIGIALTDWL